MSNQNDNNGVYTTALRRMKNEHATLRQPATGAIRQVDLVDGAWHAKPSDVGSGMPPRSVGSAASDEIGRTMWEAAGDKCSLILVNNVAKVFYDVRPNLFRTDRPLLELSMFSKWPSRYTGGGGMFGEQHEGPLGRLDLMTREELYKKIEDIILEYVGKTFINPRQPLSLEQFNDIRSMLIPTFFWDEMLFESLYNAKLNNWSDYLAMFLPDIAVAMAAKTTFFIKILKDAGLPTPPEIENPSTRQQITKAALQTLLVSASVTPLLSTFLR